MSSSSLPSGSGQRRQRDRRQAQAELVGRAVVDEPQRQLLAPDRACARGRPCRCGARSARARRRRRSRSGRGAAAGSPSSARSRASASRTRAGTCRGSARRTGSVAQAHGGADAARRAAPALWARRERWRAPAVASTASIPTRRTDPLTSIGRPNLARRATPCRACPWLALARLAGAGSPAGPSFASASSSSAWTVLR